MGAYRGLPMNGPSRARLGALAVAAAMLAGAVGWGGCGSSDEALPGLDGSGGPDGGFVAPDGSGGAAADGGPVACASEGEVRTCHQQVGKQGDVITCYSGIQTCTGGVWGACVEGKTTSRILTPRKDDSSGRRVLDALGGSKVLSLSDAGPCIDNPCDPYCNTYDENPDGGSVPVEGGVISDNWQQGSLSDFPPGLVNKGLQEPCTGASSCQFNEYCSNPGSGTCSHSKCATGTALITGCDPCVTTVCNNKPGCCAGAGTCAHGKCVTGAPLTAGCDACVTSICAADPMCCTTGCEANHDPCATGTKLPSTCNPGVAQVCAQDPSCCSNTASACAHDPCNTGTSLTAGCDTYVGQVCAANALCCQGNTTTCAHDPCQSGAALPSACNAKVAQVNAQDPYCAAATACAVEPCTSSNGPLNAACDPLVAYICANDKPSCCTTKWTNTCKNLYIGYGGTDGNGTCTHGWDSVCTSEYVAKGGVCGGWDASCVASYQQKSGSTCQTDWSSTCVNSFASKTGSACNTTRDWDASCVAKVATTCNQTCPAWDASCVAEVEKSCGVQCSETKGCAHDRCLTGGALASGCDACVTSICAADPTCCTTAWTQSCVDKVKTVCNAGCPVAGDCVPWDPGATNPNCAGYDLTVAPPCGLTIPVCNVGNTTAPAGIKLYNYPANSMQYPKCNPDLSFPQVKTCTTTAPIPPGQCIQVSGCVDANDQNREIIVNPTNAVGALPECTCENNWSLYNKNTPCKPPACASASAEAKLAALTMYVMFDKSGSMGSGLPSGGTRWSESTSALKTFFQDPTSAGLGVALNYFPETGGCGSTCTTAPCATPVVPQGVLTAAAAPADTQEAALVASINAHSPGNGTPMSVALQGSVDWAIQWQATHPSEKVVVVLVTDGQPNGCDNNVNNIAAIAGNAFTTYGIRTYVIGIIGVAQATVDQIAAAGGTTQAFYIGNGNVAADLLAAFKAIQAQAITSCDIVLQNTSFDPTKASVTYTNAAGTTVTLNKQASAAGCGSGWYFDNPTNPSKITLCPTTCNTIKADLGAKINLVIGCPLTYTPTTYTQTYEGKCPVGTHVKWGYLTYNSSTPKDSNVVFEARVSNTMTFSGAYTPLATAKATPAPDTQVCTMSGPAPTCPVNVGNALGAPGNQSSFLQLGITINPSSDKYSAPSLKGWDLSYSCPPTE